MVRRLETLAEQSNPNENVFLNQARVEQLLGEPVQGNPARQAEAQLRLAKELLGAGRSKEAAEQLVSVVEFCDDPQNRALDAFSRNAKSLLGTAYLRIAEQQNCIGRHSPEACLLPLSGAGVHQRREYTLKAYEVFLDLLTSDPEDLESRWLLNLSAMALGQHPDSVPTELLIPPSAFASELPLERFRDIAHEAGVATMGRAGGVVFDDLNGDDAPDLLVSSWGLQDQLRLYANRGTEGFIEQTLEAGLEGLSGGLNLVQADYDNDGDLDVLVLRGAWLGSQGRHPDSLLRNNGGHFEDVTESAGLLGFHPGQTAAWADVDNDGWLDLFIGHESSPLSHHPSRFFRNLANGTFEERTSTVGVTVEGFVKGASWGDVDNDGLPDLFVSRFGAANMLLLNVGGFTFRDITEAAGVAEPRFSFPTWFFDFDNDGWLDLFVGSYARSYVEARANGTVAHYLGQPSVGEKPRLFRNRGDRTFEDVTEPTGLARTSLTMAANYGDLDNDGYLDLYLGTGAPDFRAQVPNLMFRNDGGRRFQDVTTSGGFGHLQKGHGIAFADYDQDGDQDIYTVLGGAYEGDVYQNALFENPGNGSQWITLQLIGDRANRAAIGARIEVVAQTERGAQSFHRVVSSGGSFGASSLQQEIGLAQATAIERVTVSWPGGGTESFPGPPLNQVVALREGNGAVSSPGSPP